MQELNIGKEEYERMSNEELIHFVKNVSQHLTFDSYHLLMTEFRSRNLDLRLLDYKENDGIINTPNAFLNPREGFIKSYVKHSLDKEHTEEILNFIRDEKGKGETNYKIYNALREKGIDENYAYMLIKSLEAKTKEYFENHDTEKTIAWLFIIGGFIVFGIGLSNSSRVWLILLGLFGFVYGIIKFSESSTSRDNYHQWMIKKIQEEKDNLDNFL